MGALKGGGGGGEEGMGGSGWRRRGGEIWKERGGKGSGGSESEGRRANLDDWDS